MMFRPVLAAADGSVWLGSRGGLNRWIDGRVTTVAGASAFPITCPSPSSRMIAEESGCSPVTDLQSSDDGRFSASKRRTWRAGAFHKPEMTPAIFGPTMTKVSCTCATAVWWSRCRGHA